MLHRRYKSEPGLHSSRKALTGLLGICRISLNLVTMRTSANPVEHSFDVDVAAHVVGKLVQLLIEPSPLR
jgi:hypothetical protein